MWVRASAQGRVHTADVALQDEDADAVDDAAAVDGGDGAHEHGQGGGGGSAANDAPVNGESNAENHDEIDALGARLAATSVAPSKGRATFAQLLLRTEVLKGLAALGYEHPSPIQRKVVPIAKFGLDVIAQAKSGTGKTLVFAITALEMLDVGVAAPQVVVLSPTREIAQQSYLVMTQLGQFFQHPPVQVELLVGGLARHEHKQAEARAQTAHILVATPGRLQQLLINNRIPVTSVRLLVLDEADSLCCGDFVDQIRVAFNKLPKTKQIMALSATWPDEVLEFLRALLKKPQEIMLSHKNPALQGVRQFLRTVPQDIEAQSAHHTFQWKVEQLCSLLTVVPFHQCLVFLNHHTRAAQLARLLTQMGWAAQNIAGALDQSQRFGTMNSLRDFQLRVLVASDLMARGIDVERINLVVNMDLPQECETYLHRVGRAGRFGTYGIAVTLATNADSARLQEFAEQSGAHVVTLGADEGWAQLLEVPIDTQLVNESDQRQMAQHAEQRKEAEAFMQVRPVDVAQAFVERPKKTPVAAPAASLPPQQHPQRQQQQRYQPAPRQYVQGRVPLFLPHDLFF